MMVVLFLGVVLTVSVYASHALVCLVLPPHRWRPLDFFRR